MSETVNEFGELTPEQLRGRRFARVFVWVTAITAVATFVFSWYIVDGQRRLANETDTQLRTLAWATLAYASEYSQFPPNDEAILASWSVPESLPNPPTGCPARRSDALRGAEPVSLRDALDSIIVVWTDPSAPTATVAPQFRPDQRPTLNGTIEEVAAWMKAMQKALASPRQ